MTNAEIADTFAKIVAILEIQGANPFRIRAYERAAQLIEALPNACCDLYRDGGIEALEALPGIGEDLALKIEELCRTGRLAYFSALQRKVPKGLLTLLDIEGMGPKRTAFVWKRFGVKRLSDFKQLLASGKLARVSGWGARSVENLRSSLSMFEYFGERMPLGRAAPLAESMLSELRSSKLCTDVAVAGSYRRRRETVGDLDILVTTTQPARVMERFCRLPLIQRVIARGTTKANVLLKAGIEADIRILQPKAFGAGLFYFTGSKAHNIAARKLAMAKGLTISEYGVFRGTKERKGRLVACRTEADVFRAIGLPFIPPEIREDTGEIEAAKLGMLPVLVEAEDIRGDLHLHSDFSDGNATMVEMFAAAKRQGIEYLALTDHASVMGMVHGLKTHARSTRIVKRNSMHHGGNVAEYVKRVRAAAKKVRGLRVLAGAEVDILENGSLYLSDAELKLLDWVVASIHGNVRQSTSVATKRLIRAVEHPLVHCIGHPTTRLIGKRAGMEFDWISIMDAAKRAGTVLELNASWHRLDIDDVRCRQAKEYGVAIAINSDAHATSEFDWSFGVAQARRGWIERRNVVNALPWKRFERQILRRKS